VAVHAGSTTVEQYRADRPLGDGAVDGPSDRWGQWDQDDLAAFAEHAQHSVAVFLAQVGDIQAGCLEDPQPEHAQQADQGKVELVARLAPSGQHCLELQVTQPERG
jgi:hypothetical protein